VHSDALFPVVRVGPAVDHQQRTTADRRVFRVAVGRRAFLDAGHHLGVGLAFDIHPVDLHDPVALPEAGALGRAAPVHLADELAAGERQTAVGRRSGRLRLFGVQVEPVTVKVLGPSAQHAQPDGGLGHLLWLQFVVGVVGRHDVDRL